MKFKEEDYHDVICDGGKPTDAFKCDCVWGTYRDSSDEPNRKYCCHILAVILYLVDSGQIPEYWRRAIYGKEKETT